jgi:multidrug resistance efflux pump
MDDQNQLLNDPKEIRLNENRDLQQILGAPPGWILKWGITVVFISIAMLLGVSWLIKYPDIIPARVVLTTEQPPIRVFSKTSGKVETLNVKDDQSVKAGQLLAIIENPAEWKDILILDSFLIEIQLTKTTETVRNLEIPRDLNLGSLQNSYAEFSKQFDEYIFFLQNNLTNARVANLNEQNVQLNALVNAMNQQKETLKKIVQLANKELERNQKLKKIGAISDTELEASEAYHLQQRQLLEKLDNEIINNKILSEKNQMLILETQQKNNESRSGGLFSIQEDVQRMKSEVENWKQTFLIIAPIDGQISLSQFWSPQQFINENEELLTIVPTNNSGKIIGRALLPLERSGKVKPLMRANIRLDGYPYQEFGSIGATVKDISSVPQGDAYQIELEVPGTLVTTYEKSIPFRQEMQGTANIITEDRRILERVFDKILSILRNE